MMKFAPFVLLTLVATAAPATSFDTLVGGKGPATVKAFSAGATIASVNPYPGFGGAVRVAAGDVTGDGVVDIVTGAGPGGGPHVKVFDGKTTGAVRSFFAYDAAFLGGIYVAAGDLNGDGRADIVTGAGAGGGPHVKVFDGATGDVTRNFFAFDAGFVGGVTVSTGDAYRDGVVDVIVGAASGSSRVRVFDGATNNLRADFFAFDTGFAGGVSLATGRYFGTDALIVGAGAGGSQVNIYSLKDLSLIAQFLAFDPSVTGGVSVAAGRNAGRDTLFFASANSGGRVALMDVGGRRGATSALRGGSLDIYEPFGSDYDGGLSIAAVGNVPEPAPWMLMILGFGTLGVRIRRSHHNIAPARAGSALSAGRHNASVSCR